MSMITCSDHGVVPSGGVPVPRDLTSTKTRPGRRPWPIPSSAPTTGAAGTGKMRITFDAMVSHDITYVGIIQTARASGMTEFPIPYALTNCHNSLCAVGGTINEDDHAFGLSAAKNTAASSCPRTRPSSTSTPGGAGRVRQNDPGLRLPHPLRLLTAPWAWARAAASWQSSC
jgi:hypothetical protein